MAQPSTVYRLRIALSDVDRGVYEELDLRLAKHPSETMPFLVTRTVAYALSYEEGIEFGKGLGDADEPAVFVRDRTGVMTKWVDVGTPSADRLHRASKACPRVSVFSHHDPALLLRETAKRTVHKASEIEAYSLARSFVEALAEGTERNARWELTRSDGTLYVRVGERTHEGVLTPLSLG
jgi:uncharacterized protein YaeQ